MTRAEKLTETAENTVKIAEYQKSLGYVEGRKAEYDWLWDSLQENGNRTDYERAFGAIWNDDNFRPKYTIRPQNANSTFSYSKITDLQALLDKCGVELDFSGVTANRMVQWLMQSEITRIGTVDLSTLTSAKYVFYNAAKLVTIERLIFAEKNVFENTWFQGCPKLTNINAVEGIISNSITFNWSSLLSPATMQRIIAVLKNYNGTEYANTYEVKFTEACWTALEADSTAPNGGTWKNYVTDVLCWNV